MRTQISGLRLLLSLLFVWWIFAPRDVYLDIQQPAATITTP